MARGIVEVLGDLGSDDAADDAFIQMASNGTIADDTSNLASRLIDGLAYALGRYGLYDRRGYMFYVALLRTAITHNLGYEIVSLN